MPGPMGENGKEGKVDCEIGRRIKDGLCRLLPLLAIVIQRYNAVVQTW